MTNILLTIIFSLSNLLLIMLFNSTWFLQTYICHLIKNVQDMKWLPETFYTTNILLRWAHSLFLSLFVNFPKWKFPADVILLKSSYITSRTKVKKIICMKSFKKNMLDFTNTLIYFFLIKILDRHHLLVSFSSYAVYKILAICQ